MELKTERIDIPDGCNIIFGQTHFIKTVEDLYEIIISAVPNAKFGIGFCEASGHCLVRGEGNDEALKETAMKNALRIGAGHTFNILLKDAFPINILNAVKMCQEVCSIYCATANPVEVILQDQAARLLRELRYHLREAQLLEGLDLVRNRAEGSGHGTAPMTDTLATYPLPRPEPDPNPGPRDDELYDLVEARFRRLIRSNPTFATQIGIHSQDDQLTDGSRDALLSELAADKVHLAAVEAIEPSELSPTARLERDLEVHHLRLEIFETEVVRTWERRSSALEVFGDALGADLRRAGPLRQEHRRGGERDRQHHAARHAQADLLRPQTSSSDSTSRDLNMSTL